MGLTTGKGNGEEFSIRDLYSIRLIPAFSKADIWETVTGSKQTIVLIGAYGGVLTNF